MRVHHVNLLTLAGAAMVALTTGASAQRLDAGDRMMTRDRSEVRIERSERNMMREPRTTGSVREGRGASSYAPGQVKKRMGAQSARDYAPGHRMMDDGMHRGGGMRR